MGFTVVGLFVFLSGVQGCVSWLSVGRSGEPCHLSAPARPVADAVAKGEVFLDGFDFGNGEVAVVDDDLTEVASVVGNAASEGHC